MENMNENVNHVKVLVVDDEPNIVELLTVGLKFQGFEVKSASNGNDALEVAREFRPDAFILDVMMPGMDGFELLPHLRDEGLDGPVLYLTAKDAVENRIHGLTIGADDYVTKPFSIGELLARLRAALRRCPAGEAPAPVVTTSDGALSIDLARCLVLRHGQPVHLTPHEWGIVAHLAGRPGQLVRKADLLRAVWGESYGKETNYLRVYLSQVRQKLEDDPAHPRHFLTEAGMGYRFVV